MLAPRGVAAALEAVASFIYGRNGPDFGSEDLLVQRREPVSQYSEIVVGWSGGRKETPFSLRLKLSGDTSQKDFGPKARAFSFAFGSRKEPAK